MSVNLDDLSTAYTLCTCSVICTRACHTCSSPTWKGEQCVKQLWHNLTGQQCQTLESQPNEWAKRVEEFIDHMENWGIPLLPWQAQAFRAIMLHREGPR